tara:strand:+ start:296 stop:1531 length:1236 start_codon:yes stop_codon:yes gene_type:complete
MQNFLSLRDSLKHHHGDEALIHEVISVPPESLSLVVDRSHHLYDTRADIDPLPIDLAMSMVQNGYAGEAIEVHARALGDADTAPVLEIVAGRFRTRTATLINKMHRQPQESFWRHTIQYEYKHATEEEQEDLVSAMQERIDSGFTEIRVRIRKMVLKDTASYSLAAIAENRRGKYPESLRSKAVKVLAAHEAGASERALCKALGSSKDTVLALLALGRMPLEAQEILSAKGSLSLCSVISDRAHKHAADNGGVDACTMTIVKALQDANLWKVSMSARTVIRNAVGLSRPRPLFKSGERVPLPPMSERPVVSSEPRVQKDEPTPPEERPEYEAANQRRREAQHKHYVVKSTARKQAYYQVPAHKAYEWYMELSQRPGFQESEQQQLVTHVLEFLLGYPNALGGELEFLRPRT